jgi:deoxyribodipyrimidine photolyase
LNIYCVSSKEIHEWHKYYDKYKNISYPKPINSYEKAREEIKEIYKNGLYSS